MAGAWCKQFAGASVEAVCLSGSPADADPGLFNVLRDAGCNVPVPDTALVSAGSLEGVDRLIALDADAGRMLADLAPTPRFEQWDLEPRTSPDACLELRRRVSRLVRDCSAARAFAGIPAFGDTGDYRVESSESLHQGFASIRRLHFRHRLFTGGWSTLVQREVLGRGPAAAVLLYDPDREQLVFIEQFRIAAANDPNGPWQLEMVAGIVDPGETPESVVAREAIEEAGCEISHLEQISRYLPSMGMSTESMFVFVGRVDAARAGGVHGLIDEGEDILVRVLDVAEARQMMAEGRISNAATIIALQWFELNRDGLRDRWLQGS